MTFGRSVIRTQLKAFPTLLVLLRLLQGHGWPYTLKQLGWQMTCDI